MCFSHRVCTDYKVLINLHHKRIVISSRETKGGSCTVWNTSFLFDLPPGDVSLLPLMLEFIIIQVRISFRAHNYKKKIKLLSELKHINCKYPVNFIFCSFLVWQNRVGSEGRVLGRVLISAEAADAGRAHWRDMCSLQMEQARWHNVQPEPLWSADTCP